MIALSAVYFGIVFGLYVLAFFLPQIIAGFEQQFGTEYTLIEVGLITAVPYAIASVTMVLWARHSDRTGERALHVAVPALVGAVAIAGALCDGLRDRGVRGDPAVLLAAERVPDRLRGRRRDRRFVGSFVTGRLADLTGDARAGLWVVAAMMVMSASVALAFRGRPRSGSSGSTKS
ncbi:hypothetical protein [Pseudonocardia kongjuensis]|uniref:hypothetical protein n=1 Tax=Pseudonocardia kongjuensis TaxID=102227 RepID=UPI0031D58D46